MKNLYNLQRKLNPKEVRSPSKQCDRRKLFALEIVRDRMLKKGFVENYYNWYLHKSSEGALISVLAPIENQQNTVQNAYSQLVYDAAASNFPDTHHHFLPQCDDVIADVP